MADVVVAGWYEGVTTDELAAAARARLRAGGGFILYWWGLVGVSSADWRTVRAAEIGDRAVRDAERENAAHPGDRRDWVVSKAVAASPASYGEFLWLGAAGT